MELIEDSHSQKHQNLLASEPPSNSKGLEFFRATISIN